MGEAWALLRAAIDRLNAIEKVVRELKLQVTALEQQLRNVRSR